MLGDCGVMLRAIGAAPFCSKVREPRLPIPDNPEDPPNEKDLPARASARLGANARRRQNRAVSAKRHARTVGRRDGKERVGIGVVHFDRTGSSVPSIWAGAKPDNRRTARSGFL